MFIIIRPWLFRILPNPPRAMALFPFILIGKQKDKYNPILLNHEKIHLSQQLEMLIFPFYIVYVGHYLIQLLKYKNHHKAYLNIIFEKEAYQEETDLNYLERRKLWNFWKY